MNVYQYNMIQYYIYTCVIYIHILSNPVDRMPIVLPVDPVRDD